MTLKPELLLEGIGFPEGPRWRDGKLWFADLYTERVDTVDPAGRTETVVTLADKPSGLGWLPDGRLLITSMLERRLLSHDSTGLNVLADLTPHVDWFINDMVVDSRGGAYIGARNSAEGPLSPGIVALVTPDGKTSAVADGLEVPNGSVITPDGRTLIVAETGGGRLTAFDIAGDGSLENRRVYAEVEGADPDGICLDAEGGVWLGSPRTHEFLRVLEGGKVTHRIDCGDKWGVACMLGGEDRRTLFLLTCRITFDDVWLMMAPGKEPNAPPAGFIETLEVEVPGVGLP